MVDDWGSEGQPTYLKEFSYRFVGDEKTTPTTTQTTTGITTPTTTATYQCTDCGPKQYVAAAVPPCPVPRAPVPHPFLPPCSHQHFL